MLEGLFGKAVSLQSGETVTVDEAYVRESILTPAAKITRGFQPIIFECWVPQYSAQKR